MQKLLAKTHMLTNVLIELPLVNILCRPTVALMHKAECDFLIDY